MNPLSTQMNNLIVSAQGENQNQQQQQQQQQLQQQEESQNLVTHLQQPLNDTVNPVAPQLGHDSEASMHNPAKQAPSLADNIKSTLNNVNLELSKLIASGTATPAKVKELADLKQMYNDILDNDAKEQNRATSSVAKENPKSTSLTSFPAFNPGNWTDDSTVIAKHIITSRFDCKSKSNDEWLLAAIRMRQLTDEDSMVFAERFMLALSGAGHDLTLEVPFLSNMFLQALSPEYHRVVSELLEQRYKGDMMQVDSASSEDDTPGN